MNTQIFGLGLLALMTLSCSRPPTDAAVAGKLKITEDTLKKLRISRGTVNRVLEKIPEPIVEMLAEKLTHENIPLQRSNFRKLQEQSEGGVIRPDGMELAIGEMRALRTRLGARLRTAGIPVGRTATAAGLIAPTAGLSPSHQGWTWLGPSNIGGRTRALVIDPHDPLTLYAGSAGGGLWKSGDGGGNWGPVDDQLANLAISTIVMDPADSKAIYAGTGEGYGNIDALRGAGIFQTTDGAAWKQLPATVNANFHFVNRLAISADSKTILAATRTGIHRSIDAGRTAWASTRSGNFGTVVFHPADSTRTLAADLSGAVFHSGDGGATWTPSTHAQDWNSRVELAYSRKDPNIVYASVNINGGELWRSTDGGKSFIKRNTTTSDGDPIGYLGAQGWYDNAVWASHPGNADFVIVGGIDLWRSTDGGNSFSDISRWFEGDSVHADHHAIVASPGFNGTVNKTVYFGNDGGLAKTDDITTAGSDERRVQGWKRLSQSLGVTQFYGGAIAPNGLIAGGAQDNGTLLFNPATGAAAWTTMFGGDGGFVAADPIDSKVIYGEYVHLNIHRSLNGGQSADYIGGQFFNRIAGQWQFKPAPFLIPDARDQTANFIAPFVLDPNNSARILGGGMSLWETTDAKTANTNTSGPKWRSIKGAGSAPVSAIAITKGNGANVWVGHNNGDVFISGNATAAVPSWKKIDDGSTRLPNRFCTRIVIDAKNPKVAYAAFGGFEKDNLWKTSNGGTTWARISVLLPAAPIRAIAIHPKNSRFLYVGSELGVFASEDGGVTWSPTNEGPTSASVDELFWKDSTLFAATHGRGMFKIDLPLP